MCYLYLLTKLAKEDSLIGGKTMPYFIDSWGKIQIAKYEQQQEDITHFSSLRYAVHH